MSSIRRSILGSTSYSNSRSRSPRSLASKATLEETSISVALPPDFASKMGTRGDGRRDRLALSQSSKELVHTTTLDMTL